jgi:ribosomal protein L11 methyltransferase
MDQFIQISFSELQPEQKDILIAQLADKGYEGFEETVNGLEAFIKEKEFDKSILDELAFKYQLHYSEKRILATNWNQLWESNFQPVIVNDFVAIRADFHEPITSVEYEIVITPKMSFGTGHHATTHMMIEQMKEIGFNNKEVFDFGTGTGILAILAEKLGASQVIAVDNDDWSIKNAIENCERNESKKIVIEKISTVSGENKYDIILANINKNVILENFNSLVNHLAFSGILLLSGILETDKNEIFKAATEHNLKIDREISNNNWVCLSFCFEPIYQQGLINH